MKKMGILIVFGMITSFVGAEEVENQLVIPEGRFEGFVLDRELLGNAIANQIDDVSSVFDISIRDILDNFGPGDRFEITFGVEVPKGGTSTYYSGISCTVYDQYINKPNTLWLVDCGSDEVQLANREMEISVSEVVSTSDTSGRRNILR